MCIKALQNSKNGYNILFVGLHWLFVVLFIALYVLMEMAEDMPKGPEKWQLYGLHKSIGVSMIVLVVLRLMWRFSGPVPEKAAGITTPQHYVANVVHFLLYVAMFAMPISGYVMSQAGGHGIKWFGLFDVPNVIGLDKNLAHIAHEVHEIAPAMIMALVGLHVVGALYNHFMLKNDVLKRMLPFMQR